MTMRILGRFVLTLTLVWVGVILFIYLATLIGRQINWNYTSWVYSLVNYFAVHTSEIILLSLILSAIVVFIFYWRKTLGYLQDVVDATAGVYNKTDELIKLPDELRDVEEQLNEIKMAAARNERAAREAEQRKNDLIVYLAHDLKTPLTSVIGYLSLLRDEQQISPELRERYLGVSLDKAQRLEDLINEFFEITRFNLTSLTLEPTDINLTRMLEQLLFEFEPMMAEKELSYNLNVPKDFSARFDADKMQRVFDNILRNAVNYSATGETIDVEVTPLEGAIAVSFSNTGVAIPADKLERIFEQFYRLDTARTSRSGGAGLGLAIAKQIAELHGGAITAQSADGQTTFTVTIPQ